MTRSNVAQRLDLAAARAAKTHPGLAERRISPHIVRHNPESRIMPSRPWASPPAPPKGQLGSALSEAFEEGEQGVIRPVAGGTIGRWGGFVEHLLFELEAGMEVNLSGFHRLMTEPRGDDGAIDPAVQQRHGRGVPQHMGRNAFFP
jgi:hypothetical protein